MDRLKQEIMTDIRKELQKLKLDIIEGQLIVDCHTQLVAFPFHSPF